MPGVLITRCRLCSQRFEEPVFIQDGWVYLCGDAGNHPLEDACPWCSDCRAKIDIAASALLMATLESPAVVHTAL